MANQEQASWVSVMSFLQKQQMRSTIREQQWDLQRTIYTDKIKRLQAELDSNKIMINDLISRIKLLQFALLQTKKNSRNISFPQQQQILKVESLIQKYRLQSKVKEEGSDQFLYQILAQIGINYKQIFNQYESESAEKYKNYGTAALQKQITCPIKQTSTFNAHLDGVRNIYVNDGSQFAITVSEDCLVKLWNFPAMKKLKNQNFQPSNVYREHTGPLFAVAGGPSPFNPEQSIFFTGGSEGLIKYWKVKNSPFADSSIPICNWSLSKQNQGNIPAVWDLALNGKNLLCSVSQGPVSLYVINEQNENTLKTEFKYINKVEPTCISWISSQTFIEGCHNAPRAHLWDLSAKVRQKYIFEIEKGDPAERHQINQISYNRNSKLLGMGCQDGALRLFTIGFGRIVRKINIGASISSVKYMNDWQIVCGTHAGSISIWDLRRYQKLKQFEKCHQVKYDEGVLCLWASENRILSGGADGSIKILS